MIFQGPPPFIGYRYHINPVYPDIQAGKHVLDSGDMTVDHRDLLLAVKQAGPHHSSSGEERDSGSWIIILN
jgi:hypothetical protein